MVIFNTMLVKKYSKIIILTVFLLFLSFVTPVKASSEPMLSIYPAGGTVTNKDNGFTVDVMIDSAGEQLTEARFVITYDPTILQLTKTEKNNTLFAQWPDDETSIDNTNGVVMLTGFSQTGTDTLYETSGSADVLARLTFKVLKTGTATLDWAYSGADEDFKSVLMTSGSPPVNVLKTKPTAVTFTIQKTIVNTGIGWNKYVLIAGGVLILFGALIVFSRPTRFSKRKGTIVIYDED